MKQALPIHAWDLPEITTIKQVHTGLLNQTFILHSDKNIYVLQQLHPAVSLRGCTSNYFDVTEFLASKKIITQTVLLTKNKKLTHVVDKKTWRLLSGVNGEVHTIAQATRLGYAAGKLLAEFHTSLKNYKKPLAKTLPMFQYAQVLKKLRSHSLHLAKSRDAAIRDATRLLLEKLPQLLLPNDLPQRIIHTDPKVSNFLFTGSNQGVCMIDLDTVQKLSPLYDIGDAVRSWCGQEEDNPSNSFNIKMYTNFLNGYMAHARGFMTKKERALIPQACQLVMLGLAARFLNDYIDDSYFGWDKKRYNSRKAHNKARVISQIHLYTTYLKSI